MGRRRLSNDGWGIESNCFVCEAGNDRGLRLPFWADDEAEVVTAEVTLPSPYSGAPAVVHGGLSLAVLDEAQAWAVIAFAGVFGVTAETSAAFHQPVWIDHPYRVEARVLRVDGDDVFTEGRVLAADDTACVVATGRFLSMGEATPQQALAADDRLRRFRDGPDGP